MKARTCGLVLAVGCLGIAACSVAPPFGDGHRPMVAGVKDCQGNGPCVINVDAFCTDNASLPCVIIVTDSVVQLKPKTGTKLIEWVIGTPAAGFVFDNTSGNKGITIDSAVFDCPVQQDLKWHCKYNKADPTSAEQFKYVVRLKGARSVLPLDPWVVTN